jgi:alanine dehydrogenase
MSTLVLDRKAITTLITMPDVITIVEEAFRMWGEGKGNMPPKAYLTVDKGDFRAMPAALPGSAGMKWVNAHPQNRTNNLPSVMAILIYNDPETGYPLAIMDATGITASRTGAAAAIASKYLARTDTRTLGIIGAGSQAYTQILAHIEIFGLDRINVYDLSEAAVDNLKNSLPDVPIKSTSIEKAVHSDILCTLTPSRQPVVKREWILPGTHINAVGADAEGKQELESSVLNEAKVVVDDIRQAASGGEINVPIREGSYSIDKVHGVLAELVLGKKKGRISREEITIFDSTGIAIEDIAVAGFLYDKARNTGGFPSIDLIGI